MGEEKRLSDEPSLSSLISAHISDERARQARREELIAQLMPIIRELNELSQGEDLAVQVFEKLFKSAKIFEERG